MAKSSLAPILIGAAALAALAFTGGKKEAAPTPSPEPQPTPPDGAPPGGVGGGAGGGATLDPNSCVFLNNYQVYRDASNQMKFIANGAAYIPSSFAPIEFTFVAGPGNSIVLKSISSFGVNQPIDTSTFLGGSAKFLNALNLRPDGSEARATMRPLLPAEVSRVGSPMGIRPEPGGNWVAVPVNTCNGTISLPSQIFSGGTIGKPGKSAGGGPTATPPPSTSGPTDLPPLLPLAAGRGRVERMVRFMEDRDYGLNADGYLIESNASTDQFSGRPRPPVIVTPPDFDVWGDGRNFKVLRRYGWVDIPINLVKGPGALVQALRPFDSGDIRVWWYIWRRNDLNRDLDLANRWSIAWATRVPPPPGSSPSALPTQGLFYQVENLPSSVAPTTISSSSEKMRNLIENSILKG
jgi:hypothetical protein